jgi:3-oxoadipate enol-lactonase
MTMIEANGTRIHYQESGKGFPLVLAHGRGGNYLSWWQQVPAFAGQYRCITFDHRGWGLTEDDNDLGPRAFPDDLLSLLDALDIESAFLLGHSMGGMTCLRFAIDHPDRVRAMVFANTFAGMRREVWLASDEETQSGVRLVWERRREEGSRRVLTREFRQNNKDKAFLYKQIRLLNENGPNNGNSDDQIQRIRALERDPEASASQEQLDSLTMPVLFIGGEHDEVMPVSLMSVAETLLPNARSVVMPDTDHSAFFERPEAFNRIVLEFLESVSE